MQFVSCSTLSSGLQTMTVFGAPPLLQGEMMPLSTCVFTTAASLIKCEAATCVLWATKDLRRSDVHWSAEALHSLQMSILLVVHHVNREGSNQSAVPEANKPLILPCLQGPQVVRCKCRRCSRSMWRATCWWMLWRRSESLS